MSYPLERTIEQDGYAPIIVVLAKGAAAAAVDVASMAQHFLDPSIAGERPGAALLRSEPRAGLALQAPVEIVAAAEKAAEPPPMRIYPLLGLALGYVDKGGLVSLRQSPAVEDIYLAEVPSLVRPVQVTLAEPPVRPSWGVSSIGAPELWAQGYRGQDVLVGHIDTGVDGRHPALDGAVAHFVEFDLDGNESSGRDAWDSDDHGTHTAGTILGRPLRDGAFGVAPDAQLVSAMVIEGGRILERILGGMEWTIRMGVRVLNASLGLPGQSPVFQALTDAIRANNVLPTFAVGNEGAGTSRYPGNYHNVLSIGACDRNDGVAAFSGSQSFPNPSPRMVPDLVAPGDDILSCIPNGGFARMSGTSMATPHVAGLAALLFSAEPAATADDVEKAIEVSCIRPSGMDAARGNRGIPDAVRALAQLRGG